MSWHDNGSWATVSATKMVLETSSKRMRDDDGIQWGSGFGRWLQPRVRNFDSSSCHQHFNLLQGRARSSTWWVCCVYEQAGDM